MKTTYTKTCPWCLQEFETTNSNRKYCTRSHGIYMSQYDNGKRDAPEIWKRNSEDSKLTLEGIQKEVDSLQPLLESLKIELGNKRIIYEDLHKAHETIRRKVVSYKGTPDQMLLDTRERALKSLHNAADDYKKDKLEIFRTKEKINRLKRENIKLKYGEIISANSIDEIEKSITRYEFGECFWDGEQSFEIDNIYLQPLGTLNKPFLATFMDCNELWESYNWLFRIGENLVKDYKTKVLNIIPEDYNDFFPTLKQKGIDKLDNYLILKLENNSQIEKAIQEVEPEFLFLWKIKGLDYNYYKNLKKRYPKMSTFIYSENRVKDTVLKASDLIYQDSHEEYNLKKGGAKEHLFEAIFD